MKKIISLFIVFAFIFTALAACGNKNDSSDAGSEDPANKNTSDTSEGEENGSIVYKAKVPDDIDYNTAEFHVLVNNESNIEWKDVDFVAGELNSEPINDAVFQRNLAIGEQFNLTVVPSAVNQGDHVKEIKKAVSSGDNLYDLTFNTPFDNSTLAQEGLLYNLYEVPNLDLSEPWWDQNAAKDLSIANKLYMITGDIGTMYKKSVGIILFNKQMIVDYSLKDPYELVRTGKWTMDELTGMCKSVSQDLNGDGKYDTSDLYGMLGYCDVISIAMMGGGVKFAAKNADDIPELSFYSDKTVSIFEKLTDVLYQEQYFWSWSRVGSKNEVSRTMFANNQALFNWNEFHSIPNLRSMETDFGILPMPKYDENQDRYYHSVNPHVAMMMAIPISNLNPDDTGAVAQAMGAVSKNLLTPAYYEISLKGKYARDDDSIMTMDTIFSSMTYDPGYMYNWGNIGTFMLGMVDKYNTELTSQYEKIESAAQKALDKMLEKFTD